MKILQLVTRRQFRGAEVFAANLSDELIGLGQDIIFAGLYEPTDNVIEVKGAKNVDIGKKTKDFLSPKLVLRLAKLVRSEKPDVVQCNGSDTLKYMAAASLLVQKIPLIYRNISMISRWVDTPLKLLLYKNIFKRISHVSSVGEEAVKDFITTFNYPHERTSVIRRGIPIRKITDMSKLLNFRKELGIKQNDFVVMHVGNFSPEKNHIFLLELLELIKKKNHDIKVFCAGTGELFEEIQEQIILRDLEDQIKLLGFRRDVPELLAVSDCLILVSKVEGVPGVILEAAAQNKPTIAVDVGGVSEVLVDEETGFLLRQFDTAQFSLKLLQLLHNKKLRESMGAKAHELVEEEFNPTRNARKFLDLYKVLIDKNVS